MPLNGSSTQGFRNPDILDIASFLEPVLSDAARRRCYDEELLLRCKFQCRRSERRQRRKPCQKQFVEKLAETLQSMSAQCRREVILQRLGSQQRAELEAHLRQSQEVVKHSEPSQGGICRSQSAGITYGYYSRVFVNGFGLLGKVRRDIDTVVSDHIFLQKVCDGIRKYDGGEAPFIAHVHAAIADACRELGVSENIIAAVQVFTNYHHFLGTSNLKLRFSTVEGGISAWEELQKVKSPPLFRGQGVTKAYSPQAALEQWQRIKEVYFRLGAGLGFQRQKLEAQIARLEEAHKPARLQRECLLWRRLKRTSEKASQGPTADKVLLRRLERLLATRRQLGEEKGAASQRQSSCRRKHQPTKCKVVGRR
eukprot:TRINITY_DN27876_c0_g1_i1.p1 TRINITY_DN27876_c0_g1~~TRINITY_DN27876_c0_g1_i1.p1  ORF type:complete len:367 (-),score=66.22 TRINITY_DN27876_c0_g1_i1:112-1212(-)